MTPLDSQQHYREERLAAPPPVGGAGGVSTACWERGVFLERLEAGLLTRQKPVVGVQLDGSPSDGLTAVLGSPACGPRHGQHVLHLVAVGSCVMAASRCCSASSWAPALSAEGGGKDLLLERLRGRRRLRLPLTHLQVQPASRVELTLLREPVDDLLKPSGSRREVTPLEGLERLLVQPDRLEVAPPSGFRRGVLRCRGLPFPLPSCCASLLGGFGGLCRSAPPARALRVGGARFRALGCLAMRISPLCEEEEPEPATLAKCTGAVKTTCRVPPPHTPPWSLGHTSRRVA